MTAASPVAHHARSPSFEGDLTIVTSAAPVVAVSRFLDLAIEGEAMLWSDADASGWSFAGRGAAARIEASGEARSAIVQERARSLLARAVERGDAGLGPAPAMFGGLSFRPGPVAPPWEGFEDASFAMPRWVYGRRGDQAFIRLATRSRAGSAAFGEVSRVASAIASLAQTPLNEANLEHTAGARVDTVPEASWASLVSAALAHIRSGAVSKLVVARAARVSVGAPFDVRSILRALVAAQTNCTTFAIQRGDGVFLGATPERLVSLRGLSIVTEALAGTAPSESLSSARELLASDKDRREHAFVVDGVTSALGAVCSAMSVPDEPRVRTLRGLHHLATPITATLASPLHVLDVASLLAPTPAVSGSPKKEAVAWIDAHESLSRGYYAAPIGWFDASGDGSFVVGLRSALVRGARAFVYAGAGIVEGSVAALEHQETALKQASMLAALGVAP